MFVICGGFTVGAVVRFCGGGICGGGVCGGGVCGGGVCGDYEFFCIF